jgi:spore coat polysaccharide biosynthesis protein SpsF (cytidylyltransferase family)
MELIRRIFESLYVENPEFSMKDILSKMAANPDWIKINSYVKQR